MLNLSGYSGKVSLGSFNNDSIFSYQDKSILDVEKIQSNRPQSNIDLSKDKVLATLKNKVSSCQICSGDDSAGRKNLTLN